MKKIDLVNVLYTLIFSISAVVMPLYLIEKKIDVSSIGFIISLGPFVFMFLRVTLAAYADSLGTKKIDIFYSVSNLLAILSYYFGSSQLFYAVGNTLEGFRSSGFWAVVRTETLKGVDQKDTGKNLVHYSNLRQVVEGLGKIIGGALIVFIGFSNTLLTLVLSSIALLIINLTGKEDLPNIRRSSVSHHLFKHRPKTFWFSAILQMLIWLPYNASSYFILPLYLNKFLQFDYWQTGLYMATYILGIGLFSVLFRRLSFDMPKLYSLSSLIVIGYLLIPFCGSFIILPLILISIGNGCSNLIGEYILVDQIIRSKDVSTDIGMTYVPLKIVEALFYLCGGFLISSFGYGPLFVMMAISIIVFLILSRKIIFESKFNL